MTFATSIRKWIALVGEMLPSQARRFLSGKLVKQVSTSMFWQAVTKGLSFFSAIWAARCLGPENLGHSGLVLATVAQVTIFTTLGIETVVVREFKACEGDARKRVVLAYSSLKVVLSLIYSTVGLCIVYLFFRDTVYFLGALLGVLFFLINANNAAWLLMAHEKISVNFRASALASALSAIVIFSWFRHPQAVFSDIVVLIVAALVVYVVSWKSLQTGIFPPFQFSSIVEGIKLLSRGRWLFLSGILVYLYTAADQPLLGYLGSTEELGKYRTAVSLTGTLQLFLGMLPMVYYPRMLEWKKRDPGLLWRRQVQMTLGFAIIGTIIVCATWIASPFVYHVLYGGDFEGAATPFVILTTAKCLVLVAGPFGWGLWAHGHDLTMLIIMGVSAVVSSFISLSLIPHLGMLAAAGANLAGEAIILIGCTYFASKYRASLKNTAS